MKPWPLQYFDHDCQNIKEFSNQVNKLLETGKIRKYFGKQDLGKLEQWVKFNKQNLNRVYHSGFFGMEKTIYYTHQIIFSEVNIITQMEIRMLLQKLNT